MRLTDLRELAGAGEQVLFDAEGRSYAANYRGWWLSFDADAEWDAPSAITTVSVPSRHMRSALSGMGAEVDVSVTTSCDVVLTSGSTTVDLAGGQVDFPVSPPPVATHSVSTPDGWLDAARRVAVVAGRDMQRTSLTGVRLRSDGSALMIDATDSYRAHCATLPWPDAPEFDALVPAEALALARDSDTLGVSESMVSFASAGRLIVSRLLAVDPPDIRRLIPTDNLVESLTFDDRAATVAALRRCASWASDEPVVMSVDGDATLCASSRSRDRGEVRVLLAGAMTLSELAFNPAYLADAIASLSEGDDISVTFRAAEPRKPWVAGDDGAPLVLLSPVAMP